jgi:hypothetical protein
MEIARRYVKKFGDREPGDTVVGYKSFSELCKDLCGVVDVLWLSGTRKWKPCVCFGQPFANIFISNASDTLSATDC